MCKCADGICCQGKADVEKEDDSCAACKAARAAYKQYNQEREGELEDNCPEEDN